MAHTYRSRAAKLSAVGLLLLGVVVTAPSSDAKTPASTVAAPQPIKQHKNRKICAAATPGRARCFSETQTDAVQPAGLAPHGVTPNLSPSGLSPADLASAYSLPNGGVGQTVAVVDPYDDPNAEADLAVYRAQYGLASCTTANGCFRKVNKDGLSAPLPVADPSWAAEVSLDLDMVSAVCPNCKIVLVEAVSSFLDDLGVAVNRAVAMGARFVSNSYGGADLSGSPSLEPYFTHPGVVITASTGDSGSDGPFGATYPAASAGVVAVGGTSLVRSTGASRGWAETAWSGTGSGCSAYIGKPSFQAPIATSCAKRAEADISAVADPDTGVAVYFTYGGPGWAIYGGTSAAAPIIAGVYALAGTPNPSIPSASLPYSHSANLNDVTTGSNGTCGAPLCSAGTGWDGPTGLGTPNGLAAFAPPSSVAGDLITNGGFEAGPAGWQATSDAGVFDAALVPPFAGKQAALTRSATSGGMVYQNVTAAVSAGQTYCLDANVATWGSFGAAAGTIKLLTNAGDSSAHHFAGLGVGAWVPQQACLTTTTASSGLVAQFIPDVGPAVLSIDNVTLTLDRVANGGFELGLSGWSTTTNFGVYSSPTLTPFEGAKAAATSSASASGQFYQFVNGGVSAGKTSCLSAVFAASGQPGAGVTMLLSGDGGAAVETSGKHVSTSAVGVWSTAQVCITFTAAHTRLLAQFYPDPNSGTLTIDSVQLN